MRPDSQSLAPRATVQGEGIGSGADLKSPDPRLGVSPSADSETVSNGTSESTSFRTSLAFPARMATGNVDSGARSC